MIAIDCPSAAELVAFSRDDLCESRIDALAVVALKLLLGGQHAPTAAACCSPSWTRRRSDPRPFS